MTSKKSTLTCIIVVRVLFVGFAFYFNFVKKEEYFKNVTIILTLFLKDIIK